MVYNSPMTGNQLKIIALITMTIDHIGVVIFPQYLILRIIGRLTYPVFAYMIAEGCFYTRNKARYLSLVFGLGAVCQIVFFAVLGSLEQSILTTFALAIITIFTMQYLNVHRNARGVIFLLAALALDAFVCLCLPVILSGTDFSIDYGFFGVLLPALVYLPRIFAPDAPDARRRWLMLACCALGIVFVSLEMCTWLGGIQWFSLVALVLLACYNGKRGTWNMKYAFYIYYPFHLVAIWGIGALLH